MSNFYVVRNDAADSWQLCGKAGMPCMARGTMDAAIATARKLQAIKANGLEWPLPVFHATDEDTPGQWNGELTSGGEWL